MSAGTISNAKGRSTWAHSDTYALSPVPQITVSGTNCGQHAGRNTLYFGTKVHDTSLRALESHIFEFAFQISSTQHGGSSLARPPQSILIECTKSAEQLMKVVYALVMAYMCAAGGTRRARNRYFAVLSHDSAPSV